MKHISFLAMLLGVVTTLYESAKHSSKIFACGEIKAKASREDEGLNGCKCLLGIFN